MKQGDVVSHYRLVEEIGEGGMGIVFKAEDVRLGRPVAIKFVKIAHSDRFEREARAVAALNHPNICTLHDVGVHEGVPFLVMEYVEGEPPRAPMPVPEAVRVAAQVAAGLAAAHAAGILHRDLKPANVRIDPSGRARILDFGLAKAVADTSPDGETRTVADVTERGAVLGTPAYMSPEQAQGLPLDARTDVFSFGVMLTELLTGTAPFRRQSQAATLTAILRDEPAPLAASVPGAPAALQSIVSRCLAKDREQRYPSAVELTDDFARLETGLNARPAARRRPLLAAGAAAAAIAVVGALAWFGTRQYRVTDAYRRAIPEAQRLLDAGDYPGALDIAKSIEGLVGQDAGFRGLMTDISCPATIRTTPEGAEIAWKPYLAPESEWRPLGRSPIEAARIPRGLLRWKVEKDGYGTVELARGAGSQTTTFALNATLPKTAEAPAGMILVPGGTQSYLYAGPARFGDFWLDRHEVTNREFKAFVDSGAYRKHEVWKYPFRDGSRTVPADDALAGFVDATGRPGPSTWELGRWRDGQDNHPVGGINWYEAQAYCESLGKSLPTVFHWYRAASPGLSADLLRFANLSGSGPIARGGRQSLTPFGALDMAGNVKEWAWNEIGANRAILGGDWHDVPYMFGDWDAHPPLSRRETFGVRCAKYPSPPDASATAAIARVDRDFEKEKPADEAAFTIYRAFYSYPAADLVSSVDATDTSNPDWRREKVSYAAAYGGERIVAYLYLPANAAPPFQTVVHFPGSSAFSSRDYEQASTQLIDFVVRSGRALLFPVYKGSFDRYVEGAPYAALSAAAVKEHLAWWAKDLGRSVDYVATRRDLDAERLAYYGFSLGGCDALVCLALEPRFKAAILLAGGLHADHRYVPEDDPISFVPRIRVPTLLIGGRDDFLHPVESAQKPLIRLLGTPETDKRHVVVDAGHVPPRGLVMKDILGWLDRYLGPVVTQGR